MAVQMHQRRSFSAKLLRGVGTATKIAGGLHTGYQLARGLYQLASTVGPLAAGFLL